MMILVTGLLRHDSGKTSFALELINAFKSIGIEPYPFKPIGGHNAWYQFNTVVHSIDLKMLVGEDAYKLASSVNKLNEIHIISPLDFLIVPHDPMYYRERIRSYIDSTEDLLRQIVLFRYTLFVKGEPISLHFFIEENFSKAIDSIKNSILKLLDVIKYTSIPVKTLEAIVLSEATYSRIEDILGYLLKKHSLVIVESFNNAAAPIKKALESKYVVVVAPGRILLYSGEDYARAVEVLGSIRHILSPMETHNVVSLLKKPLLSLEWTPRIREVEASISPAAEEVVSYIVKKH